MCGWKLKFGMQWLWMTTNNREYNGYIIGNQAQILDKGANELGNSSQQYTITIA